MQARARVNAEDSEKEGEGVRTMACMFVASCIGRGRGPGKDVTSSCTVIVIMRRRRKGWWGHGLVDVVR